MASDQLEELQDDSVEIEEHPAIQGVTIKLSADAGEDGEELTPEYLAEFLELNDNVELVQATFRVQESEHGD